MIITGMKHFEDVCKKQLVKEYNQKHFECDPLIDQQITLEDVFVVWSCKTLQNYKALLSTTVSGDGIYVEYTYNGDKQELYEDFYHKMSNRCITTE